MIHFIPLNDEKEHKLDTTCECGVELIEGYEGDTIPKTYLSWEDILVVHRSFDNREIIENLIFECFSPEQIIESHYDNWAIIEV